jgi:hypothetical protein
MSTISVRLPRPTDCDSATLDEFKHPPKTAAFRDDSGNSSDSSSSEHLPLSDRIPERKQQRKKQHLQQQQPTDQHHNEAYDELPMMQPREKVHDRLWQSADVLLELSGYIPLHKTVCCALCRYNLVTLMSWVVTLMIWGFQID